MDSRLEIGYIASGYRTIADGRRFNRFFSSPDNRDRFIRDGDVDITVDLMKRVVWKYILDTKRIAAHLKGTTVKQTCENVWDFLYHHIQYKLDKKGLEQLRRPNRSWAERNTGIDCDCFSIFVSSILTNLQIPHSFRITKYNKDTYQHVYVIVPSGDPAGNYIIDCVLGKFNYEKPFTAKKDFPMSLDKIDIAVLSGTESDVMDVIAGLDGLDDQELPGAPSQERRSQAIYEHLVKTRNLVAQKPYLISQVDYPPAFIKMLDYAIANWHTPNRTAALENLARNEDVLNRINGMDGVPDETELDGTDDLWSHIDGLTLGEIEEELNGKSRKAKRKAKRAERKKNKKGFFRKVGQAVKKGVKAMVRFNPLTIAARNGFLLAMKLNLKKMASRLKWAYATREQAAAKGVSTKKWEQAKKALAKIEKLFADKLQGKKSALKNAILKGRAKGLNGLEGPEEEIDIRGLGFAPAAALAAAIPVITAVVKIMKDTGLMKKGEAQNVETDVNAKASEVEASSNAQGSEGGEQTPAANPVQAEPASSSSEMVITPPENAPAPENTDSGGQEQTPSQDGSENLPATTDDDSAPVEESTDDSDATAVETNADDTPPPSEEENPETQEGSDDSVDGIFDLVQSKPFLIAGGIGLGIWGLSWLLAKKEKPARAGLGSPPGRKKKKKQKHPRRKTAKRKTVRAITLR